MYFEDKVWAAESNGTRVSILPKMANRHGLIAGATGTGKTITLKVMAESFSDCGVPVFLADVKGDLAGMCCPGEETKDMKKRMESFGLADCGFSYTRYPVCFWDIEGKRGLPLRTTISEMGPTLLARLLDLTEVQTDILSMVFRIADDDSLLLIDTKDLRSMLQYVAENSREFSLEYGNLPKQSLNAILRAVMALESQGGDKFFGEPALDIHDWFKTDRQSRGVINILDCRDLINSPLIYSTFMLWMMSELFEILPEAGDAAKPKMVFFFDEAHLLFEDAPKALETKIEQVVKLVRSKGVGIYFITQNPSDIPDGVLSQLGNRVQHALRAYTPAERKKIRAAAESFRENPEFDTETVLEELGTGEALVSFLDEKGRPGIVQKCRILPPQSLMGPVEDSVREGEINGNPLAVNYQSTEDRDSAYEILNRKRVEQDKAEAEEEAARQAEKEAKWQEKEAAQKAKEDAKAAKEAERAQKAAEREAAQKAREEEKAAKEAERARKKALAPVSSVAKTAAGTIGRELGNELGKKVGGTFGKRLGGNIGAQLCRGLMDTLFGR